MNIELTRGHKDFDAKVKNLEGILTKIETVLDVSEYKKRLKKIVEDVNNNKDFKKSMPSFGMQSDYESYTYKSYIDQIKELTYEVERDALPFYTLHLFIAKLNASLSQISGENIAEIINDSKSLLDQINELDTHNDSNKNDIINLAYRTLYSAILSEEIFERSEIYDYLISLNIPTNLENIGRLAEKDVRKLNKDFVIDEELKHLKDSGLGFDYLSEAIIKKISKVTVGDINSEYQERKSKAYKALESENNDAKDNITRVQKNVKESKKRLTKFRLSKALAYTKILSLLMVPIITISAGYNFGKKVASNHLKYKTITRTVDLDTKQIIDDQKEVYEEKNRMYVATILIEDPWSINKAGTGYTHTVTAYEFITSENLNENFHITKEDLEGNVKEKYSYVEHKDVLDSTDSTTNSRVLVTETFQDKSDSIPNTVYTVLLTIAGTLAGIGIDIVLGILAFCNLDNIKELNLSLNEAKNNKRQYVLELERIKEDIEKISEKRKELEMLYGLYEKQTEYTDSYTDNLDLENEKTLRLN